MVAWFGRSDHLMPIEVHRDGEGDELEEVEPGQQAFEALQAVAVDADELTLVGLLGALQRGTPWKRVPPAQRKLCEQLEGELFDEEGDGG